MVLVLSIFSCVSLIPIGPFEAGYICQDRYEILNI